MESGELKRRSGRQRKSAVCEGGVFYERAGSEDSNRREIRARISAKSSEMPRKTMKRMRCGNEADLQRQRRGKQRDGERAGERAKGGREKAGKGGRGKGRWRRNEHGDYFFSCSNGEVRNGERTRRRRRRRRP